VCLHGVKCTHTRVLGISRAAAEREWVFEGRVHFDDSMCAGHLEGSWLVGMMPSGGQAAGT